MSWNTAKILPVDKVFSRLLRLKVLKCQRCGKLGYGPEGIFGLQASHFYSRRRWNLRFDEINVDVLCVSCHQWAHKQPTEFKDWKIEQLGQKDFDLLTLRSNLTSPLGSSFWKNMKPKQAEKIFTAMLE